MADIMQQILEDLGYDLPKRAQPFDPQGEGYDMVTARLRGYSPQPVPGDSVPHWQTRAPLTSQESVAMSLPPDSGMILKGAAHPTWDLGRQADRELGYELVWRNGRAYSVKR